MTRKPLMRRPLNAPPLQNIALALTALCGTAHAQEANTTASGTVATIVVTGSREGTTALKSLAPVQVVDAVALRATGESDLRTALASVSPSYINVISNGGALAKNTRGSSLRGLSGNQVLILVNGKRRHGSSLINNSGGASLGSSAADLGHIPVSAVERVEVLTDGAAAQYGSDAIAGVINVILKSEAVGGAADITYGEYNHSVAKVGDIGDAGRTETANLNKGLELGSNGGFLNLSASVQDTGDSAVLGPWKQPTKPIWQLYAAPGDPREATANRYEVSPALALRGTVSNGFRAPSLAEQYYSSATVQPTNDPITNTSYISYNYDTVPPDSPAAVALGASKLKAEKSNNISLGAVLTPTASLSASLDVYQIDIKDRIYLTGAFNGFNTPVVANILKAAGLTSSQAVKYFANIGKTRTRGLEAKLDYTAGSTTWGLSYAYNQQKVLSVNTPAALQKAGLSLLGRDRIALLEEALPQHILRGTLGWRIGAWQVDVVESFYSKTRTVNNVLNADQDSVSPNAFITDASLGYRFTKELKATIGSRNLFNKRALDQPAALASTLNYENPYPNQNTPYGFGGAFYYARLNYQW